VGASLAVVIACAIVLYSKANRTRYGQARSRKCNSFRRGNGANNTGRVRGAIENGAAARALAEACRSNERGCIWAFLAAAARQGSPIANGRFRLDRRNSMLLLWSGRNDTAALRVVCHASGFGSLEHLSQRKKSPQYVEESACEPLPVMYLALWHYPRHKASRSARAFLGRLAPEGLHPEGMPRAPRDDRLRLACATLSARGWPARAASLDS
jgi:hypothetical protein